MIEVDAYERFTCHFSGNKDITRINLSSFPVFQASQLSSSFTS